MYVFTVKPPLIFSDFFFNFFSKKKSIKKISKTFFSLEFESGVDPNTILTVFSSIFLVLVKSYGHFDVFLVGFCCFGGIWWILVVFGVFWWDFSEIFGFFRNFRIFFDFFSSWIVAKASWIVLNAFLLIYKVICIDFGRFGIDFVRF